MKRIIQSVKTEVVSISEITDTSIVGIDWGASKCMVIRVEPNVYKSLSNGCQMPNLLNAWIRNTQQEYVKAALEQGSYVKAYVFDDNKELFKWMSN